MNWPQAVYALKVALATVLALAFSFMLDLQNTYWALMTIPLVARPDAGSMVWRSAARLAGTLIGALVSLMLIANFAQSAGQMIAALALWIFATSYLARLMSGTDAYAYGVAGLTALVIVLDTGPNAPAAYGFALARTTETVIAIVASFVVLLVVFPVSVENQVKGQIAGARRRILALAKDDLSGEATVAIGERMTAFAELLAIHATLRAQAFERSRRNWRLPRMTEVAVLLNRTLVAADAAAFALGKLSPAERQGRVEEERVTLCRMLADYPPQRTSVEETQADAAAIERFIASLNPDTLVRHLTQTPGLIDESLPRRVAALYRLRLFAESLRDLLVAEAALLDPDTPTPKVTPISARYRDRVAALEAGLRPALTFVAASSIWIASGWSAGGIFTLLVGALVIMLPTIIPRPVLTRAGISIGLGYAAGAAISLALMIALPLVDSLAAFALIMGATMFVIFYIAGTPETLAIGIGATLMLAVGLQPTNQQTYSAIGLFNTVALLTLIPLVFVASMTILFPQGPSWLKRHLRRGLRDLLGQATARRPIETDAFIAQTIDILGDYGGDLDAGEPEVERLIVLGRAVLVTGLECHELRRLATLPEVPASLSSRLPQVLGRIRSAAGLPAGAQESGEVFTAVREEVRAIVADAPPDGPPLALLRFGAVCELLQALVASGDLADPRIRAIPRPVMTEATA
ncbi:MAG: hypothetical protein CMP81_04615 [Fulvimarina sp.]|nr:hypothetical protein [Fulvimarina sp.]